MQYLTHSMQNIMTSRAIITAFIMATLMTAFACSDSPKPGATGKTTTNTPPIAKRPPKADPHMDALKAKMATRQKDDASKNGERGGLYISSNAENLAQGIAAKATPETNKVPEVAAGKPKNRRVGGAVNTRATEPATGEIDRRELSRAFRRYNNGLQNCYERGLKRNPSLRGKVGLMLTISSAGRVANVNVRQNTLRDQTVVKCMTTQARRWVFPKPDGGSITVAKTFVFAPQT